jgi:hypothetical protein
MEPVPAWFGWSRLVPAWCGYSSLVLVWFGSVLAWCGLLCLGLALEQELEQEPVPWWWFRCLHSQTKSKLSDLWHQTPKRIALLK